MADVELQEQSVPLKNAEQGATEGTETAAGGEQAQGGESAAPEQKKEKKGWFAKKKTIKTETVVVTTEKGNTEAGTDGEGQNNVNEKQKGASKKCPFSFCRPQKCAASGEGQQPDQCQPESQPSFQFNLVQRDDRKLQEPIDLGVDQIFGEPDAVHAINGVWKTTLNVFLAVRNFIYKLLSLIFAIPLAVVFGVLFALVSVLSVYVFVPVGRLLSIPFGWLAKVWSVVVGAVLDPICRSCGLFWGNVRVSQYGINQDPTAVITA